MGAGSVIAVTVVAALGGILLQPTKEILTTAGFWRDVQPINDFPYTCRKIEHPQLEGCEDLWIDEKGRELYLACSDTISRTQWCPSMTRLNNSGRSKTDHFSVLSLDTPGADGLHNLRTLKTSGYSGTRGDNVLDLHGFDVDVIGGNALRLWAVNHRPPLDPVTGSEVDAAIVGANSTVEVFEIERHGDTLQHIETYADALIQTPNRVTPTGENGFVMTNDKSVKVGFRRELDLFVGGGFLVHCQSSFCQRAIPADQTLKYPNGIIRNIHDGLYYVPSSADGRIYVYSLMPQGTLSHVDTIFVGQPMDNLSVDSKGDIFAAAFPKALAVFKSFDDPHGTQVPSAVFRIRREEGGYVVHKVIEDRDSEALNMVTGVVHDVKTGRLWAGGVHAPFITVCEPK